MTTHYETLGIAKDASSAEIKKAYRKIAMKYHPDRNPGNAAAEEKFKEANEAQEVLMDGNKRAAYDRYGDVDLGVQPAGPFGFSFTTGGASNANLNDILSEMLRKTMNSTTHQHQTQKHLRVNITLEDAYSGTTISDGGVKIHIPPGVRTGNRLVHGNDLITVVVQEHQKFKRTGDDLLVDIQLNAIDAMLGVAIKLSHIDDSQVLKFNIESGIQHHQVIRLRGKGMPNPELGGHGDLLIRCNIVIPVLTNKQKSSIMHLQSKITLEI